MGLLAMHDGAADEGKPVVELLGRLDGVGGVEVCVWVWGEGGGGGGGEVGGGEMTGGGGDGG